MERVPALIALIQSCEPKPEDLEATSPDGKLKQVGPYPEIVDGHAFYKKRPRRVSFVETISCPSLWKKTCSHSVSITFEDKAHLSYFGGGPEISAEELKTLGTFHRRDREYLKTCCRLAPLLKEEQFDTSEFKLPEWADEQLFYPKVLRYQVSYVSPWVFYVYCTLCGQRCKSYEVTKGDPYKAAVWSNDQKDLMCIACSDHFPLRKGRTFNHFGDLPRNAVPLADEGGEWTDHEENMRYKSKWFKVE